MQLVAYLYISRGRITHDDTYHWIHQEARSVSVEHIQAKDGGANHYQKGKLQCIQAPQNELETSFVQQEEEKLCLGRKVQGKAVRVRMSLLRVGTSDACCEAGLQSQQPSHPITCQRWIQANVVATAILLFT
jgi:hypothetical protein